MAAGAVPRTGGPQPVKWTFEEDFTHGIPAWMSYPMAQDVGYDPSLYATSANGHAALERDVVAEGERRLHVGLLRPLRFHATDTSRVHLSYRFNVAGGLEGVSLTLGTSDGKRYTTQLTRRPGPQQLDVTGGTLGIGAAGADIEVIVIEAVVRNPALGSHNRLTISSFSIDAMRVPQVQVVAPRLVANATGQQVAAGLVTAGSPLVLRTAPTAGPSTATLFSPAGVQRASATVPPDTATPVDLGADPPSGLWRAVLSNEAGRTEFAFLVMGSIPPHPRVLFDRARLQQLKSDPALRPLRDSIHTRAIELEKAITFNPDAGMNIARLSPDSVFPGLVAYFTLMDSYANAIGYNALDYRLNGNARALDVARRALLTVATWPTWTPPWFGAHGLHTYYEAGIFTQRAAFGYDLIADELSAGDRERIAQAFWTNEIDPAVQEYFANDRLPIAVSNHMAHTVGGALAAALAVAGDVPDWNAKFAPEVAELLVAYDDLLRDMFPGDGSEAEPAGYEEFAMQGLSWGAAALNAFGIRPPRLGAMLDAFWWVRYSEIRPDLVLDTGDFNGKLPSLSGFAWPAEISRNPALRQLYERADHEAAVAPTAKNTSRGLEAAGTFLDLACCTWPQPSVAQPPPSRIFPGRGSAVLRSGWGDEDSVISLRAGPWFNHEHHDQGSFQVAAFGEKLIGEAGYTNYYTDPRYADYFTQVPGHNSIELDNDSFSQQASDSRYWPSLHQHARLTRHVFSSGIDYVNADITDAYDGALQSFTREYLFLKPDVFITLDRITALESHNFTYFVHVPPGAHASVAANTATITGEQASALLTSANGNWDAQDEPTPVAAYGNLDRQRVPPRSALRLTSTAQTKAAILVGMRFIRTGTKQEPLAVRNTVNATGFASATNLAHTVALFRTAPGELVADGVATDGKVLAVNGRNGANTVFASSARYLQEGGTAKFSASSAVDLVMSADEGAEELTVSTPRRIEVRITTARLLARVAVDGHKVPIVADKSVSFHLAAGEHTIRMDLH